MVGGSKETGRGGCKVPSTVQLELDHVPEEGTSPGLK